MLVGRACLLFLLIFLCSCSDDCEGIDCLSQDSFTFTVKSETSGDDLLIGSDPQLSEGDIEVVYMKDGAEKAPFITYNNSGVSVGLVDDVEEYHISVLGKTDVVNIQTQRIGSTECCPATTQIGKIYVNGSTVADDYAEFVLLR